jgi:hypothetical protein
MEMTLARDKDVLNKIGEKKRKQEPFWPNYIITGNHEYLSIY